MGQYNRYTGARERGYWEENDWPIYSDRPIHYMTEKECDIKRLNEIKKNMDDYYNEINRFKKMKEESGGNTFYDYDINLNEGYFNRTKREYEELKRKIEGTNYDIPIGDRPSKNYR